MPERSSALQRNDAADAFYGQSDDDFVEQIQQICVGDPRLIAVFEKTRERYLQGRHS